MTARRGERGLALVSVLWGVAILSLIAAAMQAAGMQSARLEHDDWQTAKAQALGDAGIQRAAMALLATGSGMRWPVDGSAMTFGFNDTKIKVRIQDENGKIDLNEAGEEVLTTVLTAGGADAQNIKSLVAAILDWRRMPETGMSEHAAPDWARHGHFQSIDELLLVPGMTKKLFSRLEPVLTLYSHKTVVDQTVAPRPVLLLVGNDPQKVDAILAARLRNPAPPALPAAGHAFAIDTELRLGADVFRRHAVVMLFKDGLGYLAYH